MGINLRIFHVLRLYQKAVCIQEESNLNAGLRTCMQTAINKEIDSILAKFYLAALFVS